MDRRKFIHAAAVAGSGSWIDPAFGFGEVCRRPNDRRSSSNHRWPRGDPDPLYPARAGAPDAAQAAAAVLPQTAASSGDGQR